MTRPDLPRQDRATPDIDSPVFQRASQVLTRVRQPDSPWSLVLGLAFAMVLGITVFASLSAGRRARAPKASVPPVPAETPKPAASPTTAPSPPPAPAPAVAIRAAPAPAPPTPTNDPALRLHAPVMVVDQSEGVAAATAVTTPADPAGHGHAAGVDPSGSADERFEARASSGEVETSRATQLRDLTHVVPQGTVIPAVLETAINSDLPGAARAVVSRDVPGFDGSRVLIPRGSKLIGQYRSGMALGQTRAFVIWARILTPDGVSIDVGSPATDPLGRGGLAGETDTHFFQRFGGAILLSVLDAGLQAAVQQESNASTAVIIGSPLQAGNLANLAPQPSSIPVTIKVMQGTPLQVFLVRDLDFSGVAPPRP